MGHQLGRLCDHRAVHIADVPTSGAHAPRRFGQQQHRISALEPRVSIRKMAADIAQRGGTQQGIGDGMQQHIGV